MIESGKPKPVPLPPVPIQSNKLSTAEGSSHDSRKGRATGTLENAFNMQARETLDLEIVRMFYSSGLPFHPAKNPHFIKAFSYAANNYIGGYVPLGYNKLRTTLLEKEREHVERMLEPIKIHEVKKE